MLIPKIPTNPNKLLYTKDVCEILEVHPNTVRVLTQKGRLKTYRSDNGYRYFYAQDIIEFLENHCNTSSNSLKKYYKPLAGTMGFTTAHNWIKEHYGKATKCEFNPIHKGQYVWANIGHTYKRNRLDWKQLCRQCHWELDHPNGRMKITPKSGRNSKSTMVSMRLSNNLINSILNLYGDTMSIGNCCKDILHNQIEQTVIQRPREEAL